MDTSEDPPYLYFRSYGQLPAYLFDPDLKRQWAKNHLDQLIARCLTFQEANPPIISAEDDLENGFYIIRTQHAVLTKLRLEAMFEAVLVLGDFITNLRSCLDHLAWKLVLLGCGKASDVASFPICEVNNSAGRKYFGRCTKGMSADAIALVEKFQPYYAGGDYRSTPLWILNKLWNIDKHRHLILHSVITGWQFRTIGGIKPLMEQVDHCTIMRFPLSQKANVYLNPHPTSEFWLRDGDEGINIGVANLTEIYNFVADTVLPAFASIVSQPEIGGKP